MTIYHFCSSHETEAKCRQKKLLVIFLFIPCKREIFWNVFFLTYHSVYGCLLETIVRKKKKNMANSIQM